MKHSKLLKLQETQNDNFILHIQEHFFILTLKKDINISNDNLLTEFSIHCVSFFQFQIFDKIITPKSFCNLRRTKNYNKEESITLTE